MTIRTKQRLDKIASSIVFVLALIALAWAILTMTACAGSSTSEITPAESSAMERNVKYVAPSAKRTELEIIIGGEEGEAE